MKMVIMSFNHCLRKKKLIGKENWRNYKKNKIKQMLKSKKKKKKKSKKNENKKQYKIEK